MLIRTPPRLKAFGWNERILTFDDFEEFCEVENILLIEARLRYWRGFYCIHNEQPAIVLDQQLRGPERLLTAWHEVGHHLLHTPGYFGHHGKTEVQADLVGHIALLPAFLLHWPDGELQEMLGYAPDVIRERAKIFACFNL